jgi:hypothetical protein
LSGRPEGAAAGGTLRLVGADDRHDYEDCYKEKERRSEGRAVRVLVEETVESIGEHG